MELYKAQKAVGFSSFYVSRVRIATDIRNGKQQQMTDFPQIYIQPCSIFLEISADALVFLTLVSGTLFYVSKT